MVKQNDWQQPAPTKAYAAWYRGKWYGEGDTAALAVRDVKLQANAAPSRFWTDCLRYMEVRPTNPEVDYCAEGLGEF